MMYRGDLAKTPSLARIAARKYAVIRISISFVSEPRSGSTADHSIVRCTHISLGQENDALGRRALVTTRYAYSFAHFVYSAPQFVDQELARPNSDGVF